MTSHLCFQSRLQSCISLVFSQQILFPNWLLFVPPWKRISHVPGVCVWDCSGPDRVLWSLQNKEQCWRNNSFQYHMLLFVLWQSSSLLVFVLMVLIVLSNRGVYEWWLGLHPHCAHEVKKCPTLFTIWFSVLSLCATAPCLAYILLVSSWVFPPRFYLIPLSLLPPSLIWLSSFTPVPFSDLVESR